MTLDPPPTLAEAMRIKTEREARARPVATHHNGVALGANSPIAQAPRRSRKETNDVEHVEQKALMTWARENEAQHPDLWLLHACPNYSGNLSAYVQQRLKEEGKKAGVPDVSLPVRRGKFGGLFIEMKIEGGQPSKAQKEWIQRLRAAGNRVEIAMTAESAQAIILHYLTDRS